MKLSDITHNYVASFADYSLVYERGLEYYEQGMVRTLTTNATEILAEVAGSGNSSYKVTVREAEEGEDLRVSCECPFQGWICKHIVAVLLAYLNRNGVPPQRTEHAPTEASSLDARLHALGLDRLVCVLTTLAEEDEVLRRNLLVATESHADRRLTPRSHPILRAVRQAIRSALTPPSRRSGRYEGFIDRYVMPEVIRELKRIKSSARLADPYIAAYIYWELADQCLRALRSADDSEGAMSALIREGLKDYASALNRLELKPGNRRRHIDRLLILFHANDTNLAKSIFDTALAICKEEADYELILMDLKEQLSSSQLPDQRRAMYQEFLVSVYKHRGDETEYLKELAKSLTSAADWLQLGEYWKERGRVDKAIEVLEEGLKKYPSNLTLFYRPLKQLYQESNDSLKVQNLLVRYFNEHPSFELYQEIASLSENSSDWPDVRARLIARIKAHPGCLYDWVRVCLREGWDEEAMSFVLDPNIDYYLRGIVADAVKETNPQAAIELYKSIVQSLVNLNSHDAHQLAVKKARVLKQLLLKDPHGSEAWHGYIETLRKENRNRTSVIDAFRKL